MNELNEFSLDTENGEKNYNLAIWYENQGHTAPAHSYYLRASERSEDKLLRYKSLIRASFCYKKQGSRDFTERTLLENALMLMPERPEAYYFLSAIYEKQQDWQQCYIYASLGLECYKHNLPSLNIQEYCGKELLIFEKAVSSWVWGRGQESRDLFQLLADTYYNNMSERHKKLIDENMNRFGLNKNQKILKDSNNYDVYFTTKKTSDHKYVTLIEEALKYALENQSDLPDWILNMEGMSGKKYRTFINKLISSLNDPKYLEIGCWTGSTSVSAIYSNKINGTLIDKWAEDFGNPQEEFFSNLNKCNNENITFINEDFRKVNYSPNKKYNVYFYDGPHSEEDQYDGLLIPFDSLDDEFIFICDDWNWQPAVDGTFKAIEKLKLNILYSIEIKTTNFLTTGENNGNDKQHSDWHNGYYIAVCKKSNIVDTNTIDATKKRIFDCFRFFNEKELLELRYHILKDHVDKFIILQGTKTQSGNSCELLAEKYIDELELPKEKFIVVNVDLPGNDEDIESKEEDILFRQLSGQSSDSYQNSLNARTRERILLDSLLSIISEFTDKDVFLVSDCDEIIKPEYIDWFSNMALQHPECLIKVPLIELHGKANLRAYYKNTNQPVCTDNVFFICTKQHLEKCTPFKMRFNILNPFQIVYITQDGKRIEECGWHFSWMGDTNRLKLKQKSTSHYADQIHSAVIQDMSSKDLETYIDEWSPQNNGTYVWGNTDTVLKNYSNMNLPKQIFELDHLRKFFLNENICYITEEKIQANLVERTDIINALIQKINAKKYLEIGVAGGQNLASINCQYKISVDPNVNTPATFHMTSDQFFEMNQETFDVIFIDGLHHADQVLKDILNSLDVLNDGGYIVCHDMNPIEEEHQIIPLRDGVITWNGDCWKAFVHLRHQRSDLSMFVVNTDHGCGVIQKGSQNTISIDDEITYQSFDQHRKEWLNLIEVEEFCDRINLNKKNYIYHEPQFEEQLHSPIPVLGVPIVNGVHWLKRLIDSIDYPVKELFIVNNNGRDQITDELNELQKIEHPFIEKIKVCHLPHNIGVSGAWNLIIKSYLMSPYWIICNNDVAFTPGFLEEMVNKSFNDNIEIVWPPSINSYYVSQGLGSFECFLVKDSVIQKCGLFDENLYPAYCEDCDYLVKIKSKNIKSEYVYAPFYHGETESYQTGSQTLKIESSDISQKIHNAHAKNREYMINTWGHDWENWEQYSNKNITIQSKTYDINFNRQKCLGF